MILAEVKIKVEIPRGDLPKWTDAQLSGASDALDNLGHGTGLAESARKFVEALTRGALPDTLPVQVVIED